MTTLNPLITYEVTRKYTKDDGENRIVVELRADVTGNGAIMPISNYDFGVGNHDPNTVDVLELLRVASPQYFI